MSDEPTRAELEALLHYYQNRAVDGEARLAASEERARRLEKALREIDAKIGHFRSLESEVTFPLALIPVCAGIARAALAPPPEGEVGRGR